ncbi:MAG: HPr family phosphocarrier protein [Clostridia bacterium]|nr:HPr family phosphocarrier protein [Clostridia bacterium]
MRTIEFVVGDPLGIHARPAGLLVKAAQGFESEATIRLDRTDKSASLKRLLAVMGLGVKGGDRITVTVQGADEEEAAEAIETWLKEHLG